MKEDMTNNDEFFTVIDVIKTVLPDGTRVDPAGDKSTSNLWKIVPLFPTDLFAVCAYLLKISNSYQAFISGEDNSDAPEGSITIREEFIDQWIYYGAEWRRDINYSSTHLQADWEKLSIVHAKCKAKHRSKMISNDVETDWRWIAYKLMVIADEASKTLGVSVRDIDKNQTKVKNSNKGSSASSTISIDWMSEFYDLIYLEAMTENDGNRFTASDPAASATFFADDRVVCVQPKSRISDVGCTTRTFSKYLSLLPPSWHIRASWQVPLTVSKKTTKKLNVLLVPFPYSITDDFFSTTEIKSAEIGKVSWGWFEYINKTLSHEGFKEIFTDFIKHLVAKCKNKDVHMIVFPELSLDYEVYNNLVTAISTDLAFKNIEMVIAGSNDNCEKRKGNYSLVTEFNNIQVEGTQKTRRASITNSSPKHHRWRIEKLQIESYGLQNVLDPSTNWWEKIRIRKREVKMVMFRNVSAFGVMICEDLARSEPAHDVFRALGANIIFGLLFDGPQTKSRWSSKYAASITEDPGTAVVSLTSHALMKRSYETYKKTKEYKEKSKNNTNDDSCWSIALWQNDSTDREESQQIEIICPQGKHAVLVTLEMGVTIDQTIEGRPSTKLPRWQLKNQVPIGLTSSEFKSINIIDPTFGANNSIVNIEKIKSIFSFFQRN